jgi:hypothetical protein
MFRRARRLAWLGLAALVPVVAAASPVTARAAAAPLPALALRPDCGVVGPGLPASPPPPLPSPTPTPTPQQSPTPIQIRLAIPAATYSIEVIGRGLPPGDGELIFNPGGSEQTFAVTVGTAGGLDTTIGPVAVPKGTYLVQLVSFHLESIAAQALFVVPCPPPVSPPPVVSPSPPGRLPPVLNPTLTLTPPVGPPGTVIVAHGTDFPANVPVTLDWSQGIAGSTGAPVLVDASGSFTATVLVFPHDELGTRVLTAVSAPLVNYSLVANPVIGFASASFLVVPGEVQPRDFSSRR